MPAPPSSTLAPSDPPRLLMAGVSLAQGLALLGLWRATDDGFWPSQTPALNFALWAFAIVWPGLLLLCIDAGNRTRVVAMASAFAAAVVALAAYLGWQASPPGAFPLVDPLAYAGASLLIACFLALLYLQPWAARVDAGYEVLFALSWRNFLVLTLAALATAIFFALLMVWAQLFTAIGITFFADLFAEDWFLFPVLTVAFGLGIHVLRRLAHLMDRIASLLQGLLWLLLPLAVALQTAFLAVLPFTGLAPLWDTGAGVALLFLNGLVLFGANAVYQTGADRPYPQLMHRLLYGGIALLPAITALAACSLYLRIDQYGWSVQRCWGALVCVLFGLFSVGYVYCIVRRRDAWPNGLARVNTVMGLLALAALLLANSPLLDFRSLSLASQLQRMERGELALRNLDFAYFTTSLARPGWLKMQALLEEHGASDPALARAIRAGRSARLDQRLDWKRVPRRPAGLDVPRDAIDVAVRALDGPYTSTLLAATGSADAAAAWMGADLNADGEQDYVLVLGGGDQVAGVFVYADSDGRWRSVVLEPREPLPQGTDVATLLRDGEISAVPRAGRDLKIGDVVLERASDDIWVRGAGR